MAFEIGLEALLDVLVVLLAAVFLYLLYSRGYLPGVSPQIQRAEDADAQVEGKVSRAMVQKQLDRAHARRGQIDEMRTEAKKQYLHGEIDLETYRATSAQFQRELLEINQAIKELKKQLDESA